jgi:titin
LFVLQILLAKPGTPVVEDVDQDSVTLSWTRPKEDGGNKVKGYVVEVREKGTNKWKPLNEKVPCKDTKFTGTSLEFLCALFS